MNKIFVLIILIMLHIGIFAEVSEQQWMQAGNQHFKAKAFNKAIYCYDKVIELNPENYTALYWGGIAYYRMGDEKQCIIYLKRAYKITNNPKIQNQLDKIKQHYYSIHPEAKQSEGITKWIVYGVDLVLLTTSTILYFDYSGSADKYNALHAEVNNTTQKNFDLLVDEKQKVINKQNIVQGLFVLSGVAITYTLVDMFLLHWLFPQNSELSLMPQMKSTDVVAMIYKEF